MLYKLHKELDVYRVAMDQIDVLFPYNIILHSNFKFNNIYTFSNI